MIGIQKWNAKGNCNMKEKIWKVTFRYPIRITKTLLTFTCLLISFYFLLLLIFFLCFKLHRLNIVDQACPICIFCYLVIKFEVRMMFANKALLCGPNLPCFRIWNCLYQPHKVNALNLPSFQTWYWVCQLHRVKGLNLPFFHRIFELKVQQNIKVRHRNLVSRLFLTNENQLKWKRKKHKVNKSQEKRREKINELEKTKEVDLGKGSHLLCIMREISHQEKWQQAHLVSFCHPAKCL